ncbi:hydrolase 76 protein [Epicoccum nigrum]|nr:hydrolase 76 protein [Epicoccum nigrum]
MFTRTSVLSLAFTLITGSAAAIDLDTTSQDSIKLAAKTFASSVVAFYDETLKEDLIPGLFSDDYYWWESGLAFNTLIEYYGLTNDSQFNARISQALQHQLGNLDAFMPANQTRTLGNDDQSFWGLASLSAHEAQLSAPATGSWLEFAKNVFDTQAMRWDDKSCNGGLKWQIFSFNDGYNYKNSASNGQFFLLAARLADLTGNATYAEWANKVYSWTTEVGLVTDDHHVYDGTDDTNDCSEVNLLQWTSNHAEFTEGAALMYKVSNAAQNWTDVLTGFVNSSSVFQGEDGALVEVTCEKTGNCDKDQRAFKGIATRSYARAAVAAPLVAESINAMISASAKGAVKNCNINNDDVECRLTWSNSSNDEWGQWSVESGSLGEVLNALSAVQALLWPTAEFTNGTTNGTSGSANHNASTTGNPSGPSDAPENTGAGSTFAASITFVLALAFATALSC